VRILKSGYPRGDTIAAIATPPGEGGVAIIRISGPEAIAIANQIFSRDLEEIPSHTLRYGQIVDGEVVDQVLLTPMRGGRSYTGEETVEIHSHGGIIARQVLATVLAAGARAALPGEFTYRAFMNGKFDLSQAEAVQELIAAKNGYAMHSARQQLEGRLSRTVRGFQKQLSDLAAILEAWVDFPEEGLEFASMEEFLTSLRTVIGGMERLRDSFHEGRMIQEGVSLCLVGAPNVGKSSLMNALLEKDRAIVTDVAGTTRDLVEAPMQLGGLHIRLVDTAGIRESVEPIEREGIRRSREAMEEADLQILVLDASRPLTPEELQLAERVRGLIVWNKCDLAQPPTAPHGLAVSATARNGLDQLREQLQERIWRGGAPSQEELFITSARHQEALAGAIASLKQVAEGLQSVSPEFLCADLRAALDQLGQIVGTHVTEDILTSIFNNFCIGK
jgi:tRNA modification GTPase